MSERMSNKIAIHNLRILKHETEEHLKDLQALENKIDEKDFIDYQAQMESEKCNIEALDIAIDSLEQDRETKEKMWAKQLNECKECKELNKA